MIRLEQPTINHSTAPFASLTTKLCAYFEKLRKKSRPIKASDWSIVKLISAFCAKNCCFDIVICGIFNRYFLLKPIKSTKCLLKIIRKTPSSATKAQAQICKK